MASEQLNGAAVEPIEERLLRLRAVYSQGISDILDRCLEELILPADQEAMLQDAAEFVVFVLAIKVAEARAQGLGKAKILAAYWPIEKAIKKEVPAKLLEFAKLAEAGGQG
jgi:hypothetical protein